MSKVEEPERPEPPKIEPLDDEQIDQPNLCMPMMT